jgi:hypothetical protein
MRPSCGLAGEYTVAAGLLEGVELQGEMLLIGRDAGIADGQLPAASSCSVVEGVVWRCDNPLKSRWPIIQVGFSRDFRDWTAQRMRRLEDRLHCLGVVCEAPP